MAAFVIASLGTTPSGAANGSSELTATAAPGRSGVALAAAAAPERCPSVQRAIKFYSRRVAYWRDKMGAGAASRRAGDMNAEQARIRVRSGHISCPRFLAHVLQRKAYGLRRAYGRWLERVANDAILAIRFVFGPYAVQALVVADCESGLSRHAHNGQYLGIFQMGSSERRIYGHGETFLAQAWAAWRYFDRSGRDWSPWSCKP